MCNNKTKKTEVEKKRTQIECVLNGWTKNGFFCSSFATFPIHCARTWKKVLVENQQKNARDHFRCSKLIFLSDMHMVVIKLAVIINTLLYVCVVFAPFGQSRIILIKLINVCVCARASVFMMYLLYGNPYIIMLATCLLPVHTHSYMHNAHWR